MTKRNFLRSPETSDEEKMVTTGGNIDETACSDKATAERVVPQSFVGTIASIDTDKLGVVINITAPKSEALGYARVAEHGTRYLSRNVVKRMRRGDRVTGIVLPATKGYARVTSLELA